MRKTPRYHIELSLLTFFGVNAPGSRWQVILRVGDGAVSEAGKGVLYIGNLGLACGQIRIFEQRQ